MKITLKAYFALKGIAQKEVAYALGLSPITICRYVNGQRTVPIEHRFKFCHIIGIDPQEFKKGNIVEIKKF